MKLHVHLDAVGGVSGDMFLATMLAVFPDLEAAMRQDLRAAGVFDHVEMCLTPVRKNGMAAQQMQVTTSSSAPPTRHWRDIRMFLEQSPLDENVKAATLGIFTLLADAEAVCHAVPAEEVHFHEIADWDSLADIVAAASLIVRSEVNSWSVGALPLGRGFVQTAHGVMPVPAPASAQLLRGFSVVQDDAIGERVTPTGAAILKFLIQSPNALAPTGKILSMGTGAGQRNFDKIANILRAILIAEEIAETDSDHVIQLAFEIDDMTPEELSVALEHIRAHAGVLDAGHVMGFGKKGRLRFCVQVLAIPAQEDDIVRLCFEETSTIGLRITQARRRILRRDLTRAEGLGVKTVSRPGRATRKVESDDLAGTRTLQARREQARKAEQE